MPPIQEWIDTVVDLLWFHIDKLKLHKMCSAKIWTRKWSM
jgi:hypothetical protein